MENIHVCLLHTWNTALLITVVRTSSLSCVPLAKNTRTAFLTVATISTQRNVHQDLIVIFRRIFLGEFGKFFRRLVKDLESEKPLIPYTVWRIFSFFIFGYNTPKYSNRNRTSTLINRTSYCGLFIIDKFPAKRRILIRIRSKNGNGCFQSHAAPFAAHIPSRRGTHHALRGLWPCIGTCAS